MFQERMITDDYEVVYVNEYIPQYFGKNIGHPYCYHILRLLGQQKNRLQNSFRIKFYEDYNTVLILEQWSVIQNLLIINKYIQHNNIKQSQVISVIFKKNSKCQTIITHSNIANFFSVATSYYQRQKIAYIQLLAINIKGKSPIIKKKIWVTHGELTQIS
ncbi:unnamed protein product [Paramecium primaurelia]|uniref:Uncharacterized protein n=1 Tax=Paramecium primaurelia TaxID=5886 RepID=A0A8S1NHD3_PARPR|nr:unnamed protein product [Paramecium primaurelia]